MGVERPVYCLQEPGDVPGADSTGVKGQDGLGKFDGGSSAVGEELGVEVSLPHPGDFQVLDGTEQGEEIPGVVTVPFGGMLFQVELPFL